MKNLGLTKGMVAGMLLFSSVALATGNETESRASGYLDVRIRQTTNNIFSVNLQKQLDEVVQLKLYDRNGELLHKEKLTGREIVVQRFDLSNLPDGSYYFEVSNELCTFTRRVQKSEKAK